MLVLHLLTLCFTEGNAIVIDIPDDIGNLCPYSDICNRSATADLNEERKRPCCDDCSCNKSCGMRLNCCFEEYDSYKLVERGLVSCIEPLEGNADLIRRRSSFYMIQACIDTEKDIQLCRTQDERGNSLIAPVSSTDTGYIYVNDECAKCNGLVDTKAWKALLVYDSIKLHPMNHLDFRDSLLANISTLVYKPPTEESWHKMKCDNNFYSTYCKNSKYKDLCAHLIAPYTDIFQVVYKNVFCARCINVNGLINMECEAYTDGLSFSGTLTLLMDTEAIGNLKQKNNRESPQSLKSEECVKEYGTTVQDKCLRVYCPEGQTETPKGCKYVGISWYITFFMMQVKLVPLGNDRLSISTLLQLGITERSNPFSWIKPPCMKLKLTEMVVYYERVVNKTDNEHVKSFIVVFGRDTRYSSGIDPSVVLPLMKQCIDNTWRANINGTTYLFSASFDEYTQYVQDGKQLNSMFSVEDRSFIFQNEPDPAVYERIAYKMNISLTSDVATLFAGIWLRKSFFCKQVRLSIDELEFEYGRIKIRSKNITIGSNKYTFIDNYYLNKEGNFNMEVVLFSVCLDDYLSDSTSHGTTSCKEHRDFMIILCTIVSLQFVVVIAFIF